MHRSFSNLLVLLVLCGAVGARALPRQMSFAEHAEQLTGLSNPDIATTYKRETLEEAAKFTRHLMREITTGSIATVFPESSEHAGQAFTMLEYHAPCQLPTANPPAPFPSLTFLLLPISLSVRNILASAHGEVTYLLREPYRWEDVDRAEESREWKGKGMDRGAMDHTRVALIGNMTIVPPTQISASENARLAECYTSYHPDAGAWLPDAVDSPHRSIWARLDIGDAYYVGGFGDRHFIGHIPTRMISL